MSSTRLPPYVVRYALLAASCTWIPIPLVDGWAENKIRQRLTRLVLKDHGVELPTPALRAVANATAGGCLAIGWSLLVWPFKKALRYLLFVLTIKGMADTLSEVTHRALLTGHAADEGWLGGVDDPEAAVEQATRVRAAMDAAFRHVDTRLLERQVFGNLRTHRGTFNRVVFDAVRQARAERDDPEHMTARDAPTARHPAALASAWVGELVGVIEQAALVPELVEWFRRELEAPTEG